MNLKKIIIPLAVSLCALAVSSARAQTSITNLVTFSAVTFTQGSTNDANGISTFAPTVKASHNTAQIISELGNVTTNNFTTAAKLVLITGNGAHFAVIDGAKFVDVSDIMSLNFGDNRIKSGKQNDSNGLRSPSTTELEVVTLTFDDTGLPNGNLQFTLQGLGTIIQSDTTPVNGTYTETVKAKIASMTGEGSGGSGPFVATGSLSISGKGTLTVVPPT